MNPMTEGDAATADESRYRKLFDVGAEASGMGNTADVDFNPAMNALRERGPVLEGSLRELLGVGGASPYDTELPSFTALSFAACERAFRENLLFTSHAYNDMAAVRKLGHVVLNRIGDDHRRMRATAQPMFIRPAATGWWRKNWIDETVSALVERLAEGGDRADLNIDLCARLPLQIVSRGVGLEGEGALVFRERLLKSIGNHAAGPEERKAAAEAVEGTLRAIVAARRAAPADDVISGLVAADFRQADGSLRKLEDEEVLGFARHILLAGGGTTWRQLGITVHALLAEPRYWSAARADRPLIFDAIEEGARWNATGPTFPRLVVADTELEGVFIPANSRIDICLGAANRDPTRWDDPDRFDPFRKRQTHLGFGLGPHLCLGQHVAREMMAAAINALMDRFPALRLDPYAPAPRLTGGLEQRGMSAIPVLLT